MTIENKIKIAIIDDHPPIIEGLKAFLGPDGRFEFVGEFKETRTALNTRFDKTPDLIILDLQLPGIDGERSLPLLKQKFPNCKVLAFSQFADQAKKLEELGFDGYLNKTDLDPLRDTIVSIVQGEKHFPVRKIKLRGGSSSGANPNSYKRVQNLTEREKEVARLVISFYSNREIGSTLHISESTVETHRRNITSKIAASSKKELYEILANGLASDGNDDPDISI